MSAAAIKKALKLKLTQGQLSFKGSGAADLAGFNPAKRKAV
ncbi:hypothetical protein ACM67C_07135 [Bergeriella denitrificans]|nr:hypothetical protein [Bergeriella denitrificans]